MNACNDSLVLNSKPCGSAFQACPNSPLITSTWNSPELPYMTMQPCNSIWIQPCNSFWLNEFFLNFHSLEILSAVNSQIQNFCRWRLPNLIQITPILITIFGLWYVENLPTLHHHPRHLKQNYRSNFRGWWHKLVFSTVRSCGSEHQTFINDRGLWRSNYIAISLDVWPINIQHKFCPRTFFSFWLWWNVWSFESTIMKSIHKRFIPHRSEPLFTIFDCFKRQTGFKMRFDKNFARS